MKRLADKVAIVVGGGQTPGQGIGNGRATAVTFAREGASVLVVDRDVASATETVDMITADGATAEVFEADVTDPDACAAMASGCVERFGRIDILHNNVGIGAGDGSVLRIDPDAWDRIFSVNLRSMMLTCKHVIPVMREQRAGCVINISSVASVSSMPLAAYKVSKAGVNALTQQLAGANASHGIRVNAILPGLMNTPMAIEAWVQASGADRDELIRVRDASVPLGAKQGTGWDVANAALFLASDEAAFVTGVLLPVDGGQSIKVG